LPAQAQGDHHKRQEKSQIRIYRRISAGGRSVSLRRRRKPGSHRTKRQKKRKYKEKKSDPQPKSPLRTPQAKPRQNAEGKQDKTSAWKKGGKNLKAGQLDIGKKCRKKKKF